MFGQGSWSWIIARVLAPLLFIPSLAGQDSLKFNVPYLCHDGATYVVHRCATGPKGEFCYYQAERQSERYNVRASVAYQMNTCKIQGTPSPAASTSTQPWSDLRNSRWDCGDGTTLTVFQCQKQNGQDYCFVKLEQNGKFLLQVPKPRNEIADKVKSCKAAATLNPPYLSEFPSAYRVVQAMNVGNPRDNVLRAIGAFYQLSEIINVLSGQHASRGYLPDEKKFLDDYNRIQYELAQAAEKKFPGQQFNVAQNPFHFSRTDPRFGLEGIPIWVTFLSPILQAQFAQILGGNNPADNAKVRAARPAGGNFAFKFQNGATPLTLARWMSLEAASFSEQPRS